MVRVHLARDLGSGIAAVEGDNKLYAIQCCGTDVDVAAEQWGQFLPGSEKNGGGKKQPRHQSVKRMLGGKDQQQGSGSATKQTDQQDRSGAHSFQSGKIFPIGPSAGQRAGETATVLVALAMTDGTPAKTNAGKVRKVPPPATEFINPAPKAATMSSKSVETLIYVLFRHDDGRQHGRAATLGQERHLSWYKAHHDRHGNAVRKDDPLVS